MTELRAAYAGQQEARLDPELVKEIEAAYREIVGRTGYGTIKVRVEAGGTTQEKKYVSVENEKKVA